MNDQREEEISKLKESHKTELENLKTNMKKMKKQWESDILQQVKQLEASWKQELDNSNESHKNILKVYEDRIATFEQDFQTEKANLSEANELINIKNDEISRLKEELKLQQDFKVEIESTHKVKWDDIKDKYEKRMSKAMEEQEAKMKEHLEEVMEKVTSQYQNKLKESVKKSKEIITGKEENIRDLQTTILNLKSEIASKDTKIQQLESDLMGKDSNLMQHKVETETSISKLTHDNSTLSLLNKEYESKIESLKRK